VGGLENWVHEIFVEKGELFLRVLNKMWSRAYEEAWNIRRL